MYYEENLCILTYVVMTIHRNMVADLIMRDGRQTAKLASAGCLPSLIIKGGGASCSCALS